MPKNSTIGIQEEEATPQENTTRREYLIPDKEKLKDMYIPPGTIILNKTQQAFLDEDLDTLEKSIERGWNVNAPFLQKDRDTKTLHYAALNGLSNVVRFLVKHGADVNAKTDDGETALDMAKREGYSDIVLFLEKYANKI